MNPAFHGLCQYIPSNVDVSPSEDVQIYSAWLSSQGSTNNVSASSYQSGSADKQNTVPAFADHNIIVEVYDPELAAFLGTQRS